MSQPLDQLLYRFMWCCCWVHDIILIDALIFKANKKIIFYWTNGACAECNMVLTLLGAWYWLRFKASNYVYTVTYYYWINAVCAECNMALWCWHCLTKILLRYWIDGVCAECKHGIVVHTYIILGHCGADSVGTEYWWSNSPKWPNSQAPVSRASV